MNHHLLAIVAVAALTSCDTPKPVVRELPPREHYVALARDFQDFRSWGSLDLGERPAQGETHDEGSLRAFVNALPPPGSTQFPVGTIIVKENLAQRPRSSEEPRKHFAMVKRGANFNALGARGWEWFELVEGPRGVAINWRGLGAPDGEGYGGDPLGTCNSCHQMAAGNDFVLSEALTLR